MLTWLEVPLIVALLVILCTGIAMLLSALFVYFRDIQPIWEVLVAGHLLRLADHHPGRSRPAAPQPGARPDLHAQPAGRDLPAVPTRVHHPRHAERGVAAGLEGRAARPDRDRRGDPRDRLLGVQPDRAAGGRGSLAPARRRHRTGGRLDLSRPGDLVHEALQRIDPRVPVIVGRGGDARLTEAGAQR